MCALCRFRDEKVATAPLQINLLCCALAEKLIFLDFLGKTSRILIICLKSRHFRKIVIYNGFIIWYNGSRGDNCIIEVVL